MRYGADCWLVNTGWVGGPYGVGKRISIRYTRALLNAALSGKLLDVEFTTDPVFGFQVPKTLPGRAGARARPGGVLAEPRALHAAVPAARGALHRELQEVRRARGARSGAGRAEAVGIGSRGSASGSGVMTDDSDSGF